MRPPARRRGGRRARCGMSRPVGGRRAQPAPAGTSRSTRQCAPTPASWPTWTGPSTVAPTPSTTRSPTAGMPPAALGVVPPAAAAEGDPVIQRDVVADLGGLADDDAGAVVDEQPPADAAPGWISTPVRTRATATAPGAGTARRSGATGGPPGAPTRPTGLDTARPRPTWCRTGRGHAGRPRGCRRARSVTSARGHAGACEFRAGDGPLGWFSSAAQTPFVEVAPHVPARHRHREPVAGQPRAEGAART